MTTLVALARWSDRSLMFGDFLEGPGDNVGMTQLGFMQLADDIA
jgi:hypothetical protein